MNTESQTATLITRPIRLMLVDDSSTFRNFMREILGSESGLEVVAHASNGKLALPRLKYYKPELIILDQEMPEMNGLETLQAIQRDYPETGVIMFSSRTVEGARTTIEALQMGALDFITKPESGLDGDPGLYVKSKLVPRIRELAISRRSAQKKGAVPEFTKLPALPGAYDICAIGISTGGPAALRTVFEKLRKPLKGSLLIVQHMPPIFTAQLAESLNAVSAMTVVEAKEGIRVLPGEAYIAPGGKHITLESDSRGLYIHVFEDEPELSCRPSVNVLFRSIARVSGNKAAGIIMTGMGNDGYLGMIEMKKSGSYLIAQSERTSLVFGMPSLPVQENLINEIADLDKIAGRIEYLLGEI